MRRTKLLSTVFLAAALFASVAVSADNPEVKIRQIRVNGKEITVYLSVWKNPGESVRGINADQLTGEVELHSVTVKEIKKFNDTEEGIAYVFVVDISKSPESNEFKKVRNALSDWIDDLREEKDYALITDFSSATTPEPEFTSKKAPLQANVKTLKPRHSSNSFISILEWRIRAGLYEASHLPARRVVVMMSDRNVNSIGKVYDMDANNLQINIIEFLGQEQLLVPWFSPTKAQINRFPDLSNYMRDMVRKVFVATLQCDSCDLNMNHQILSVAVKIGSKPVSDVVKIFFRPPSGETSERSRESTDPARSTPGPRGGTGNINERLRERVSGSDPGRTESPNIQPSLPEAGTGGVSSGELTSGATSPPGSPANTNADSSSSIFGILLKSFVSEHKNFIIPIGGVLLFIVMFGFLYLLVLGPRKKLSKKFYPPKMEAARSPESAPTARAFTRAARPLAEVERADVINLGGHRLMLGIQEDKGARKEQEDAFGFSDSRNKGQLARSGLLAVLADGMGGLSLGKETSNLAVQTFLGAYEKLQDPITVALQRALRAANDAVLAFARNKGLTNEAGTTLVGTVVHNQALYWISAGDSRIYLWRDGALTLLTEDHVYARELEAKVAEGDIHPEEAERHPERGALTSFLGLEELREIDHNLRPFTLRSGDRVLLCSDGLHGSVSEEEMAEILGGRNPQSACEKLVQRAISKQKRHQDNVTVVVLAYE